MNSSSGRTADLRARFQGWATRSPERYAAVLLSGTVDTARSRVESELGAMPGGTALLAADRWYSADNSGADLAAQAWRRGVLGLVGLGYAGLNQSAPALLHASPQRGLADAVRAWRALPHRQPNPDPAALAALLEAQARLQKRAGTAAWHALTHSGMAPAAFANALGLGRPLSGTPPTGETVSERERADGFALFAAHVAPHADPATRRTLLGYGESARFCGRVQDLDSAFGRIDAALSGRQPGFDTLDVLLEKPPEPGSSVGRSAEPCRALVLRPFLAGAAPLAEFLGGR